MPPRTTAFEAGIPPTRLAEARTVVAGVPLIAYAVVARRDLLIPARATIGPILLFGSGLVAVNWTSYTAIDRIPVVALALQYTAPVMVLVGVAVVARRSPGGIVWVAALLTLIGAVLVSGAYNGLRDLDGLGVAAGIGAAISFGIYLLSAEGGEETRRARCHGPGRWLPGRLGDLGNHPSLVGLAGGSARGPRDRVTRAGRRAGGDAPPFLLVVNAHRRLPAAVAGIAATTEPVFGSALAWLLLSQSLGAAQLAGGGLAVSGVIVAQFARRE